MATLTTIHDNHPINLMPQAYIVRPYTGNKEPRWELTIARHV